METESVEPLKHRYTSPTGVGLEIDVEQAQALQALADDASVPGSVVSVSDLVGTAIAALLGDNAARLKSIAKAHEEAELERVELVHGGEAA
jgi:hypothetical protein